MRLNDTSELYEYQVYRSNKMTDKKKKRKYPSERKSKAITASQDFKVNNEFITAIASLVLGKLNKKAGLATYSLNEQSLITRSLSQLQVIIHKQELFALEKQTKSLELEKLKKTVDLFSDMDDKEFKELVKQASDYMQVVK
jgi:hypothetical protein